MALRVWLHLIQVSDTQVRFTSYQAHLPRVSDTGSGRRYRQVQAATAIDSVSDTHKFVRLIQVSDTQVRFASYQVRLPRVSDTGSGRRSRQVQAEPPLIVN